ncbi:helix-turn-helix transcriptional regulator [Streptomyces sp. ISL-94]|uniref:helix-turn-helix transcriptional regulator n=1 Tax=Streptomyces sp. ISL-94 TaxID=2819190 RepID=UPI001BE5027B|nr:helix-turn-helix domain-containing protein [Streptomyces sp. ISL-94]MBT2477579.1 helix-turn-helix domain-containing protein [Streptomyces sp. ISL-94]
MSMDWDRLGKALQAARLDEGITQEDLADVLGVGRSTIQMIEVGHSYKRPTPTVRAFARRVGWTEDSVDRVLEGGAPRKRAVVVEQASPVVEPSTVDSRLPLVIVDELEGDDPLLDATVIPLGDDARMVIIVKGSPDASPEEMRRNVEAWRRAKRHLQALEGDDRDDTPPLANRA